MGVWKEKISSQAGSRGVRGVLVSLAALLAVAWSAVAQAQSATYRVAFEGQWTTSATPGGVPSGAHFSPLIGAVHNDQVTFWRNGGTASDGIESMAEIGGTSVLKSEIDNAKPDALDVIERNGNIDATGRVVIYLTATPAHPLVTLVTMVAPSPDWFVGVSGLSLLDTQGEWLASPHTVDLFPYDAGTEEGTEFDMDNAATSPQGTITSLRGTGKFSNELIARLTFKRVDEAGSVTLFPEQPQVGTVLRARLSDPDGIERRVSWRWATSSDKANWTTTSSGTAASYTPADEDRGIYLRATATYTDGEGSGKTAEAVSDHVVGERAPAPEIRVSTLVSGLTFPWGIAFTPDGTMLFTERGGNLSSRLTDGTVQTVSADFSDLFVSGEAGLMAIVVDPDFASNRRFYTCQGHTGPEVQVTAWTFDDDTYTAATRANDPLVGNIPAASRHSGCRLRFGPQGYLWIATGDAASGTVPQDLNSLGGKVLKVDASTGDGAPGNPFAPSPIYTYGHRNVQGLALRPGTSQIWTVEHGPSIDDEINLLSAGGNYGWDPVPGYNESVPMTDLVQFPSAIEAKWSSGNPTLATSGSIFLEGDAWGEWEGRLAVATLKNKSLRVFEFTAEGTFMSQVVVPELDDTHGRLRTPMLGPAGALYVSTSNGNGQDKILKITPVRPPPPPAAAPTRDPPARRRWRRRRWGWSRPARRHARASDDGPARRVCTLERVHHRANQHGGRYRLLRDYCVPRRSVGGRDQRRHRYGRHRLASRRGNSDGR